MLTIDRQVTVTGVTPDGPVTRTVGPLVGETHLDENGLTITLRERDSAERDGDSAEAD